MALRHLSGSMMTMIRRLKLINNHMLGRLLTIITNDARSTVVDNFLPVSCERDVASTCLLLGSDYESQTLGYAYMLTARVKTE